MAAAGHDPVLVMLLGAGRTGGCVVEVANGDPLGRQLGERLERTAAAEDVERVVDDGGVGMLGLGDDFGRVLDRVDVLDKAEIFHRRLDADLAANLQQFAIVASSLVVVGTAAGRSGNHVNCAEFGGLIHPPFAFLQLADVFGSGRLEPALEVNGRRHGQAVIRQRQRSSARVPPFWR